MKRHIPLAALLCALMPATIHGDPAGNGDVNGDGKINVADAIYLLEWQFSDGPEPVPLASASLAPTEEDLEPSRHHDARFTMDFLPDDCEFVAEGSNDFFILEPGYRLTLQGEEEIEDEEGDGDMDGDGDEDGDEDEDGDGDGDGDGDNGDDEAETVLIRVEITVLDELETVDGVITRVVEEREWEDGEIIEVSRNFFALCAQTGDLYYFGEDVDEYEDGEIVGHDGAWRAGENDARAGVLVPGSPIIGARFFQEVAPGVALDRAEIIDIQDSVEVEAGEFETVMFLYETSGLNPDDESIKYFAKGVGLVIDDVVELIDYGFING